MNRPPQESDDTLKSLGKVALILDCFSAHDRALSITELSQRTGFPKTTVHRLVTSMRDVGLLDQDRTRERYRLGLKLLELGNLTLGSMDIHREAQIHVASLQRVTDVAVNLAVFGGYHAIAIHRYDPSQTEFTRPTYVESAPLHCTSVGKAMLAFQPAEVIDRVVAAGLEIFTENTIGDGDKLREELSRIRERGYSTDRGEHEPGLFCVGAPIRDQQARVMAALSASGPEWKMATFTEERLSTIVKHHARKISTALGFRPSD